MDNNYDQCKCFIIRKLLVHLFFPLFRSNDRKKKTPEIMIFLCRYVIEQQVTKWKSSEFCFKHYSEFYVLCLYLFLTKHFST